MFLSDVARVDYKDPWARPFELRLEDLLRRKRRVAYFYELPDTSTFRYRVYNMVQVLNELDEDVSASWFCRADYARLDVVLAQSEVLVICRARYDDQLASMVSRAKRHGCRVVFDSDDLVFDTNYAHLLACTLDQDLAAPDTWDRWFAYIGRIAATARLCDRAIVTNDYLADRARESLGREVRVVPNFINREQLALSSAILAGKRASRYARDGRIHIGYFSGSPSHNRDFAIVADVLAKLLAEDPRLRLRIVGFLEPGASLGALGNRVERHDLQDFLNLQRLIGTTEINIAPLQDNAFTNCKSELKYFDAGIVGTVTIASPTFVFREAIRDGENGRLARAFEWEAKLRETIASLEGAGDAYVAMAELAAQDSEARFGHRGQREAILAAVFD